MPQKLCIQNTKQPKELWEDFCQQRYCIPTLLITFFTVQNILTQNNFSIKYFGTAGF